MNKFLEFGYEIRDVNLALKEYLKSFDLVVPMEGKNTRLRVIESTPDEALMQKRYPCVYINPGYDASIPTEWQGKESTHFAQDPVNPDLVNIVNVDLVNLFYVYQIGFVVLYQSHCDKLLTEFIRIFPRDFNIEFKDSEANEYSSWFQTDGEVTPLDNYADNQRIYRREILLTTKIVIDRIKATSVLKAFGGVVTQIVKQDELQN